MVPPIKTLKTISKVVNAGVIGISAYYAAKGISHMIEYQYVSWFSDYVFHMLYSKMYQEDAHLRKYIDLLNLLVTEKDGAIIEYIDLIDPVIQRYPYPKDIQSYEEAVERFKFNRKQSWAMSLGLPDDPHYNFIMDIILPRQPNFKRWPRDLDDNLMKEIYYRSKFYLYGNIAKFDLHQFDPYLNSLKENPLQVYNMQTVLKTLSSTFPQYKKQLFKMMYDKSLPRDLLLQSGLSEPSYTVSKTKEVYLKIMIVGESGTGKSLFINSLANLLYYPSSKEGWQDPEGPKIIIPFNTSYYSVKDGKFITKEKGLGASVTDYCTSYKFKDPNGRVIEIIDTPGLGDTREGYDKKHIANIFCAMKSMGKIDLFIFTINALRPRNMGFINQYVDTMPKYIKSNCAFVFTFSPSNDKKKMVSHFSELGFDGYYQSDIENHLFAWNSFFIVQKQIEKTWEKTVIFQRTPETIYKTYYDLCKNSLQGILKLVETQRPIDAALLVKHVQSTSGFLGEKRDFTIKRKLDIRDGKMKRMIESFFFDAAVTYPYMLLKSDKDLECQIEIGSNNINVKNTKFIPSSQSYKVYKQEYSQLYRDETFQKYVQLFLPEVQCYFRERCDVDYSTIKFADQGTLDIIDRKFYERVKANRESSRSKQAPVVNEKENITEQLKEIQQQIAESQKRQKELERKGI